MAVARAATVRTPWRSPRLRSIARSAVEQSAVAAVTCVRDRKVEVLAPPLDPAGSIREHVVANSARSVLGDRARPPRATACIASGVAGSKQNRRDSGSSASRRFCFAERSWVGGPEPASPGGGRVCIRPAGKKGYTWIGVSPILCRGHLEGSACQPSRVCECGLRTRREGYSGAGSGRTSMPSA